MSAGPAHIAFYPSDWLAGTRGMTAAETGVYITLTAMMYERAAPLNMDRPRLARLCGIPAGSFKRVLGALVEDGKIIDGEDGLWSRRVAKELGRASEKTAKAAASANARWASDDREIAKVTPQSEKQKSDAYTRENTNENNDPPMRSQCDGNANQNQNQNHKDDDEDAGADSDLTFREKILIAMGHDPSGMTATGRMVGNPTDMLSAQRWTADLGLSETEIVTVVKATASGRPPIGAFRYFDQPMQQFAAAKSAPALQPVHRASYERPATEADERQAMTRRVLAKFAEGIDA